MRRWILPAVAATGILALAAGGLALRWTRGGRALREGETRLEGLEAPVTVRWDRWGVPYVTAAQVLDLARAEGWLHATDRFTQMELGRRRVAGRLAEAVGKGALPLDREALALGLRRGAEKMWEAAGPESRRWLEAYAQGVNGWLEARRGDLPPTLSLLGLEPAPWTPVDSLSFAMLMARDLSFWQGRPEELRFRWLVELGAERTRDLLGEEELKVAPAVLELAEKLAARRRDDEPGRGGTEPTAASGSNNWAVGPARAAGGRALVANDPHLALRLPGVWYEVHLAAPGFEVAGMSLPGLPGVVIGRTRDLAWAFTNVMLDDHDLLFEELSPDGERVRRGEDWVPIETTELEIPVKGGRPVPFETRWTDQGPLLAADPETGLPPRTLLWTALVPSDPLAAFLHLASSSSVDEIAAGITSYVAPAQNLVVADGDGKLLYIVLGRLPARRQGDGKLPAPGWDLSWGWEGLLPPAANPRIDRPADGLLATANSEVVPAGPDRSGLSADFDLATRRDRIRGQLAARTDWTPEALARLQTDLRDDYALEIVRRLSGPRYRGRARRAWKALAPWSGDMETRGPAALFALTERALLRRTFDDEPLLAEASDLMRRAWLLRLLRGEMSAAWFDDVSTEVVESRDEILQASLDEAWRLGVERWGADVAAWDYGALHPLLLRHPLGRVPLLGRLVNRGPYPMPGSATTVSAFGGPWAGTVRPVRYGPSMRWIAVPGTDDSGLAVLPGGQSGHPFDPHYDDQLALYLAGRMRPVPWSEAAIEAATVSRLELEP